MPKILLAALLLSACAGRQGEITLTEQVELIEKDLNAVFSTPSVEEPLSLADAMTRGIEHNMDKKLAEMERELAEGKVALSRYELLPDINVEGEYFGRKSDAASSSQSVATGQQSLTPSISSERHQQTMSLETSWDALDISLSYIRSKQTQDKALIAKERQRKVIHNLMQDVRSAYWRSAASQLVEEQFHTLRKHGQEAVRLLQKAESLNLDDSNVILRKQSQILEAIHELGRLRSEFSFAKTELSALINVPAQTNFKLNTQPYQDVASLAVPGLTLGGNQLETMALFLRPEMREETLETRISEKNIQLAVLETFPGLNLLAGYNHDNNKFLQNNNWTNFSVGLTQNLIKLFTLPARYEQEKKEQKLSDLRRQTLAAAIMTQTRIALTRYHLAKEQFRLMQRIHDIDVRMYKKAQSQAYAEMIAKPDLVLSEIRQLISKLRSYQAYVELQNSYGRVINTVGLDPLPARTKYANKEDLKTAIENRLKSQSTILENVYWAIYDVHGNPLDTYQSGKFAYKTGAEYKKEVYGTIEPPQPANKEIRSISISIKDLLEFQNIKPASGVEKPLPCSSSHKNKKDCLPKK